MKESIQSGTLSSEHSATTARERIPRVSLKFTPQIPEKLNESGRRRKSSIIFVRTRKQNPKENIMNITAKIIYGLLLSFALLPAAQAVSPPPDGGYPGGNTAEGQAALFSLTTGGFNTAVGFLSLRSNATGQFNTAVGAGTLLASTGDENTAIGAATLLSNTTGVANTAIGAFALLNNTAGLRNTAIGDGALESNTIGGSNTCTGTGALSSNTTGGSNTATGDDALSSNLGGNGNSAFGDSALSNNSVGNFNTAVGLSALFSNNGDDNTAIGESALLDNTSGTDNTAIGGQALQHNVGGAANTATGFHALFSNTTGSGNTAIGDGALTSTDGDGNTALGAGAGAAAINSHNVYIGAGMNGVAGESNACYIASIFGQTSASGMPVLINSNNKLGTTTSSARFKEDIKPMDDVSEALFALKPVTFRYKKDIDPIGISQLGLVAEEVDKVNPDLVVRDKDGKPYSVRYDQVNAMLLNEFLKEHRKVEQQERTIIQLQKDVQAIVAHSKQQDLELQSVHRHIEMNRSDARITNVDN